MVNNPGPAPERCPNPECSNTDKFTPQAVRFEYARRKQLGTVHVEQIQQAKIVTWKCDRCLKLFDLKYNIR